MDNQSEEKWPARVYIGLGILQVLFTVGAIGTEIGYVVISTVLGTVYAGFYCSLFFIGAAISSFMMGTCYKKSLACAITGVVFNTLSIGAASVVLYYDSYLLNSPFACLIASTATCAQASLNSVTFVNNSVNDTKLTLVKVQTACGALLLTTNVVHIVLFTVLAIRRCRKARVSGKEQPGNRVILPGVLINPSGPGQPPVPMVIPGQGLHAMYVVQCPYCYGQMRLP